MQPRWLQHAERGGRRITRFYKWLCLTIGRRPARPILYGIALYFLITAPAVRRASRGYMARMGAAPPYWIHAYRQILTFSSTIVDRLFFLSRGTEGYDIEIHGIDACRRLMQRKEGFLVVSAHFGNFDALRVIGRDGGNLPIKILMYPDNSRQMNAILDEINPAMAETVIPLGSRTAMLEVREWIEQGGVVGVLADRSISGGKAVRTEFLGDSAEFPLGPWLLANALRVSIMVCFAIHHGKSRYEVFLEPFGPVTPLEGESRTETAERLAIAFAQRLEHFSRLAPYNWFNFYDFWGDTRGEAADA